MFLAAKNIRNLQDLTPKAFDEYRIARQKGRSAKTLYIALLIVKTFVKWNVDRDLLERNPITSCRVIEPYVTPKTSATLNQVKTILEKATGTRRVQYSILAFTGIRAGELQHLRPEDVDLTNGWIHVRASQDWMPKTRRARKIPMHPKLNLILGHFTQPKSPYYFCSAPSPKYPKGDHLINIKHLNEDFQTLAKCLEMRVGRKNDGLVIQSLRHFFETQAVYSGVPQFVVDSWMGHKGHETIGRVYYDLTDEKSQAYIAKVCF